MGLMGILMMLASHLFSMGVCWGGSLGWIFFLFYFFLFSFGKGRAKSREDCFRIDIPQSNPNETVEAIRRMVKKQQSPIIVLPLDPVIVASFLRDRRFTNKLVQRLASLFKTTYLVNVKHQ